ncbi:nodulate formation efficiency C protein [Bradyrhizobium huanghuaihaiense]|uniref:nodulate formation efficiency C protein n=1 Tax=Bradyrhizobium huanghuaihaiense TaxID=990078 RepID=UPI0021AA41E0|nr:nodulate formation efficiency C protein [Bradyrhizobium sp. CB3035]UWU80737.1 nodulate formation efficiency C protein [Bradyrhizobium sp. CB3035]
MMSLARTMVALSLALSPVSANADEAATIARVKSTWRAQNGETAEEIFGKVAKVAHFFPRGWEVGQKTDSGEPVFFSWAKNRNDKTDDEYTIAWEVTPDGAIKVGPPYAKPMELGWQAFALSLIASEVTDGEKGVKLRFLHDPANFNFVRTAQGKLGDLLRRGHCTIGDPVGVDYLPKVDEKQTAKGDLWRVEMSVNCDIPGPRYFTRDGIIIFEKPEGRDWEPQSFFAKRIATYAPGSWFDHPDSAEQEIFEAARKAQGGAGMQTQGLQSPFLKNR